MCQLIKERHRWRLLASRGGTAYLARSGAPSSASRCAGTGGSLAASVAEGFSPHWVARHGLLRPRDPDSVYQWLNYYLRQGIAGVFAEHKQQLQQEVCHAPAALPHEEVPASRWALERIRSTFPFLHGYSLAGVWYSVRGAGLRLRQGRPQMWSPDTAYREKVTRLLCALRQARQHRRQVVVLFLDEMSYTLWPEASRDWCEQAPAPIPKALRRPAPFRRRRLIGALNALTGRVYYQDEVQISGEVAAAFLQRLATAYRWAQTIYIVWDIWPVHSSEAVKTVLRQVPRLQVISLPTYAPWLNPIEKLVTGSSASIWITCTASPRHGTSGSIGSIGSLINLPVALLLYYAMSGYPVKDCWLPLCTIPDYRS
jgi:transposase